VDRRSFACAAVILLLLIGPACAQIDIEQSEGALIDQQPYDLITVADGGAQVKVFTIPFPNRQVPSNPKGTDKLEVVLLKFPDREYEIAWKDIARIDLFEQRIYDEALQKMDEKDFINAFQNLSFLMKNYPKLPRLEQLRQEFLLKSAADRYQAGEYRQTLSALEELRATAPDYQSATVSSVLSRVADALIEAYRSNGDLASAKALLNRLTKQYGRGLPVVAAWQKKLEAMAFAKREEALQLMQEEKFRQARQAAIDMLSILPDLKEGQELVEQINQAHPMVRVGVMQRSGILDPTSLVNWPARRAGSLVYRPLFQFLETGAEGGRYGFALGTFRISDDRQQLILSLDPNIQPSLDVFELTQLLLDRANPQNADYDPSWAAIFQSVSAKSSTQVVVQLKRPNVLPHALLQWILPAAPNATDSLPGPYRLVDRNEQEASFAIRDTGDLHGQPVEVIEIFYDDPRQAVNDLLRGNVDVLDQLYPADAKRLAIDPRLRVGAYALPTTHMLIPVSKHAYLSHSKFRRALLYATNREAMLTGELLNSTNLDDGRLISGPFPIGRGESDPLAYAYNPDIQPTAYNPQLARLLLVMTQQELREQAKKLAKPEPTLEKLVVGCPDFEFARVAVQAMIQQWLNVGIQAEMLVLSPEETFSQDCDLIYVTTTMWEPATDIERLLGGNGIAATDNPFIVQALERLRASRNWREVRTAMQDLHQLVDYHLPVLPLWQITDRFAVSRYVEGLEDRPVSLYQDIAAWRVNLAAVRTVQR
jgi:tetratricopeptide (TPR) repeat protein